MAQRTLQFVKRLNAVRQVRSQGVQPNTCCEQTKMPPAHACPKCWCLDKNAKATTQALQMPQLKSLRVAIRYILRNALHAAQVLLPSILCHVSTRHDQKPVRRTAPPFRKRERQGLQAEHHRHGRRVESVPDQEPRAKYFPVDFALPSLLPLHDV